MSDGETATTMGGNPRITVVVCTYSRDRLPLLRGLLASLAAGRVQPLHTVIAVDRNPALAEELRAEPWPLAVRVIASPGAGLADARNAGWRAAVTELVAFIDDDAVASRDWLREIVGVLDSTQAAVAGGRIDAIWTAGRPRWFSDPLGWIVGCSYEGQPTELADVRNVIGCNMLIRRELLEALGGFDPTLGRRAGGLAGCEETEFCIRARVAGARVVLTPRAGVAQVLPPQRGRLSYAIRRGWDEGRSKRALTSAHRGVLGPEGAYSRLVVRRTAAELLQAARHLDGTALRRGAALAAVASATGAGYAAQAVIGLLPPRRVSPANQTAKSMKRGADVATR